MAHNVTGSHLIWSRLYYPSLHRAARPADFSDYLEAMRASLREPGRMAALRGVAADQQRCQARIPELRCPVLIVMGTRAPDFRDVEVAARDGEALIGQHTEARLELIDGVGHLPEHLAAAAHAVEAVFAALRGYGLDGDEAVDATRVARSSLHGFVSLEIDGGLGRCMTSGSPSNGLSRLFR